MYVAMAEREEIADHMVQVPTNHGSAGYVEYITGEKGCDMADISKINHPSIPINWKIEKANATLKEQPSSKIDNPGELPEYYFTHKFDGKRNKTHIVHTLQTAATPVASKGRSDKRRLED